MVTHDHLCLDLADRLDAHGNRDQHGARAERRAQAEELRQHGRDGRQHSEEQRAEQRQTAGDLGEVVAGRAALADAGDDAAVLLHVLADISRIEGDAGIEVGEGTI